MSINNVELTREEFERFLEQKLVNIKELEKDGKDSNYIHEI
jgi:hypothetical protein